jgi:hypothetical protein
VVKATLGALQSLRLREDIYASRGLQIRKPEAAKPAVAAPVAPATLPTV